MDFRLPEIGEGVIEAELVEWHVHPGDSVHRGDSLAEVMTDKATMDLPAPFEGTIESLGVTAGSNMSVGQVILGYSGAMPISSPSHPLETQSPPPSPPPPPTASPPTTKQPADQPDTRVKASPAIRRMAAQTNIDLANVKGSGPDGRILLDDIRIDQQASAIHRDASTSVSGVRPGMRMPLQGIRAKIAEHMVAAKRDIPHYSYVDECDVTRLVDTRDSLKDMLADHHVCLTYLPFFVAATVRALQRVPLVNASLDESTSEIVLHDSYNIGIATATDRGLMVPVIHNADELTVPELALKIDRLSRSARNGSIALTDLRGGTFTITSIGGIGGLISTPVINQPEVGIMGIGKIVKRPCFDEMERVRAARMVYLSFSFDHRVLDGAIGAEFGNAVIDELSHPARLLAPLP